MNIFRSPNIRSLGCLGPRWELRVSIYVSEILTGQFGGTTAER